MSLIFKMRRGKKSTMKSTKADLILENGEPFLEYPDAGIGTGPCRIKVGNGLKTYAQLPYAFSITDIKKNGVTITPSEDGIVDITIPTKVSQLTNDSGFKSTDTTYNIGVNGNSIGNGSAAIRLAGSNGVNDDQIIKGTGATTVTTDSSGNIIVNSTNTVYTHPNSGVTAGTYKNVTVNAQGHVTAGTNPTTLSGYGITDAANKTHTHSNTDISSLDATKLTGTIDIARLPAGALERCVVVATDTARFALTTSSVQVGDTVKVTATGKMYFVIDTSKLSTEAGYEVYTAGSATSVPWSGVTGKPSTFTPSSHTHTKSQITDFPTTMPPSAHTHDDRYYTETEMDTLLAGKASTTHSHAWGDITGKPSSFTPSTHTHDDRYYTESEMNTKLAAKSDTTHSHTWSTITGKPSTFTPSSHNHDNSTISNLDMAKLYGTLDCGYEG